MPHATETSKNEFPVLVLVGKVVRFAPNRLILVKIGPIPTVRICYLDCHDKPRGCVNALLKELFFNIGQECLVFSRRWGRFMFEATDGWVPGHCQASNFTHVPGRWQRLVFQQRKVWTMRRILPWDPICAGSVPHFGLMFDPAPVPHLRRQHSSDHTIFVYQYFLTKFGLQRLYTYCSRL